MILTSKSAKLHKVIKKRDLTGQSEILLYMLCFLGVKVIAVFLFVQ